MFKKLWKVFLIILIVVCIFFPVLAPMIATFLTSAGFPLLSAAVTAVGGAMAGLGAWGYLIGGAVGFGLAYAMDPGTTTEIIEDVVSVASKVAAGVTTIAGNVASSLLSRAWPLVLLGLGYLVLRRDPKKSAAEATPTSSNLNRNQRVEIGGAQ